MATPKKDTRKPSAADPVIEAPKNALVQPPIPDMLLAGATSTGNRARQWNRWRERYNPLRGLNMSRAVTLCEQYQRGEMADPQWVYFFVEQADADLFAILERREAALLQLDWNVKLVSGKMSREDSRLETFDHTLAVEQATALREAYERIDNLPEAVSHLQLATFRGFAHCEKYRRNGGEIFHLELVDQWNMVRDLLRGRWKYNPDATTNTYYNLPEENLVDPADFLIRERDRHVNRIALIKFIRTALSDKDWDAFIEIYGIPSGVVIGPQGVQPEKEDEYKNAARDIAEGGSGYLPYGSIYTPNDSPRGVAPFRPRLDYLSEKLVLAGTGGLLTMLAQSGSGTLAGSAHQESFDQIARAEAKKISMIFQRDFDAGVLEAAFPGKPRLAYFEIAANDELDPEKISTQALNFRRAGYKIDAEELSEKSGYQLIDVGLQTDAQPEENPEEDSHEGTKARREEPEEPLQNRLAELAELPEEELPLAVSRFVERQLPRLCNQLCLGDRHAAKKLCNRIAGELMLGKITNGNSHHDGRGKFTFAADQGGGFGGYPLSPKHQSREFPRDEQRASISGALAAANHVEQKSFSLGRVPESLAKKVLNETGGLRNWTGREMRIDSDFIRHARHYHPNLTDDDFHAIPELMTGAEETVASETDRHLPAVEFHKKKDGRDYLLVSATLNKSGQIQMTTLKKTKPEHRA